MTTQTQTKQASTDHLPTDAQRVGTDEKGRTHYHSRIEDAMFVATTEDFERHDLNGRGLGAWVMFVDIECGGWRSLQYNEDGIAGLFTRIEKAAEGDR